MLARIENVRVQWADFLARIFGSDFEHPAVFDLAASRREGRLDCAGEIAIGGVQKKFAAGATGGNVEVCGSRFHSNALSAIVNFKQAHDCARGKKVADSSGDLMNESVR